MITVVGAVAIDLVAVRERFLEGTSNPSDIRLGLGGVGYRIFSGLETPRRFVTALASDPISRWAKEALEAEGDVAIQEKTGRDAGPPLYLALMESGNLKVAASDFRIVEQALTLDFAAREVGDPGMNDFLVLDANLSSSLLAGLVRRYAGRTRVVFEPVSVEKARRHADSLRGLFLITPTIEELDALCPESASGGDRSAFGGDKSAFGGDSAPLEFMAEREIAHLLLTRGREGTRLYSGGLARDFPPRTVVHAGDTTGAGDQLVAALLTFLHEGRGIEDAVRAAMDRVEERLQQEAS
jgi:sugar/nucleoside kinase (ribokinase family)